MHNPHNPAFLPVKLLKKKIEELVGVEYARWVLFERLIEELNLIEDELAELESMRDCVWNEEWKGLGL